MKKIVALLALLLAFSLCGTTAFAQAIPVKASPATADSTAKIPTKAVPKKAQPSAKAETPAASEVPVKAEASAKTDADTEIPGNTKAVTGLGFLSDVEKSVIKKINKERAALGLGELTVSADLRSAARIRSRELYKSDTFAHKRPDGTGWETVLKTDVPFKFHSAGENLCTTEYSGGNNNSASSASFWFDEWKNSPKHYENMIKDEFTQVGVGIYSIEKDGVTRAYATTIFASLK